jgi:hypothetical protein
MAEEDYKIDFIDRDPNNINEILLVSLEFFSLGHLIISDLLFFTSRLSIRML